MRTSLLASLLFTAACAAPEHVAPPPPDLAALIAGRQIVDLSHAFDAETIVWPTSKPFRLERVAEGMTPGGYYYAANDVFTSEHGGTHLDAPVHFAQGRHTADAIPLSRLVGEAAVVDVTRQAQADTDYLVTVADLAAWESTHGPLTPRTIVLFRTGFSARWPDPAHYLGTAARGAAAVADLHFPGLHPDAAAWLVEARDVGAVGIDTASIDRGQSNSFLAHRALASADVPIFENLTQLDALPARGAVVVALPMKVAGGSGGPLRAVALLP